MASLPGMSMAWSTAVGIGAEGDVGGAGICMPSCIDMSPSGAWWWTWSAGDEAAAVGDGVCAFAAVAANASATATTRHVSVVEHIVGSSVFGRGRAATDK